MLKHAFVEGLKNVTRSFWLSATAVSVLTVSLASVAFVTTISTIVGYTVRQLDNQLAIIAYFNEGLPSDQITKIRDELSKSPDIKSAEYINKDQVKERLAKNNENTTNLINNLNKSNIQLDLEYIEIIPSGSESYNRVADLLKTDKYKDTFSEIVATREFVERLKQIYNWTRLVGLALGIVFALVSILVMVNILRIAIYNYKDEIEIMRLVGATNAYIRSPFIAQGAYFNLIAALFVVLISIPLINIVIPQMESYLNIKVAADSANLVLQIYTFLFLTIFVGILVGVAAAYMATQRYLKS